MTSQHIQKTLEAFDKWLKIYFTQIPLSEEVIEKMKSDISRHVSQALTEQHEADVQSFREKVEGMRKEIANSWTIRAAFTSNYESIGYNQAIQDIIDMLSSA